MEPAIYIAFRFHGNFYHSYRGDTPDELGFGKDIRIIRIILQVLDEYNQRGVPVCGTWDFENYFSLEKIMPEYCPDIIEALQRRVRAGRDEMEFMSYNNGLVNAHTAREFEENMRRAISNPAGSGLRDLFGEAFEPMVRPQEMNYTPMHLKLYKALGINSISLYYSAVPFNGFSTFIPPLATQERYNPLTLSYPGMDETMTLMPAYNLGDLIDHLTLRRWVKQMRRLQLAMPEPCDLLLLLDHDADDEFWFGFDAPGWLKNILSTLRGLPGLLDDVKDLDFIRFTTPGRYLEDHPPVGTVAIGQDTSDGSFDGLSSWSEKWANHVLYTGLDRARILDLQTRRLAGDDLSAVRSHLQDSFEARLKVLSTTHFGMAAPVMNLTREYTARTLVDQAVQSAAQAFDKVAAPQPTGEFKLIDYVRGESTDLVQYQAHPSKALIRLPMGRDVALPLTLQRLNGEDLKCAVLENRGSRELVFVEQFDPEQEKTYRILPGQPSAECGGLPVVASQTRLQNEHLQLVLDEAGQVVCLMFAGEEFAAGRVLGSAVTYGRKTYHVKGWSEITSQVSGPIGLVRMRGMISLPGGYPVQFERELLVAAGLPYLYVRMHIRYPRTPDQGYAEDTARRLQQAWDNNWKEVMPCQIHPDLLSTSQSPLRVWKHNYFGHVSTFDLDYGRFSPNKELPNVNNQITHAWVAVSDGRRGLLVAQNADIASSVAFCPLRTRLSQGSSRVLLNPFGTYTGSQYRYATADTGLGRMLSTRFSAADHLKPYAPSYNGREQAFDLMLAPYSGDAPPETVCHDAEAFGYPYIVLNDGKMIAIPAHRSWDGSGLGETPDGNQSV